MERRPDDDWYRYCGSREQLKCFIAKLVCISEFGCGAKLECVAKRFCGCTDRRCGTSGCWTQCGFGCVRDAACIGRWMIACFEDAVV